MAHWGMEDVQACFGDTADLNTRQITVGGQRLGLLFLDGLTSGGDIAEQVLKPLMETVTPGSIQEVLTQAERARVYCAVAERTQDPAQTADKLLHGYCAVIFPGTDTALCFETKTSARRGPSAPESENTVKGAKDAFTETMRINTSLLRRHLRTAQLRFSQKTVGLRTKTAVTVCYLADLTAPELVRRMEKRLENIDIDGMLTPASVEEYVTGSRRTAFPLLQYTERPDTFCQGLLNGQVGLLVDGLPLGYLAPVDLGILMKSTEDRAVDYVSATCVRILRYAALFYHAGPDTAKEALKRLKLDNYTVNTVSKLLLYTQKSIEENEPAVREATYTYGKEMMPLIFAHQHALLDTTEELVGIGMTTKRRHLETVERMYEDIIKRGDCISIKDLDITGNDLMEYGLTGTQIGKTLKDLLHIVLENPKLNEKETLVAMIEHLDL